MSAEGYTVLGIVITALLSLVGILLGLLYARINRLEARLKRGERYNRAMWIWARKHIDLYYVWRKVGAPDPEPLPAEDDEDL